MEVVEGTVCKPNISPRGRRLRQRFGAVMIAVAAAMLTAMVWRHAWWPLRALVFLPMQLAGYGFLQASRNTCLARAREGTFEHDDMSKTAAADDEVAASRQVARGIRRDATLLGAACATLALATALLG